jgi:diacylglycerol kinase
MTTRRQPGRPRPRPAVRRGGRGGRAGGRTGPGPHRRPRREVDSFRWGARGVRTALAHEPHLRFHAAATVVVAVLAVLLPLTGAERAVLLLAVGLVWVAELVNTAVERLVDLVSPRFDVVAGQVKDVAAGAVLVAAVVAAGVGAIVLGPPLVAWVRSAVG